MDWLLDGTGQCLIQESEHAEAVAVAVAQASKGEMKPGKMKDLLNEASYFGLPHPHSSYS